MSRTTWILLIAGSTIGTLSACEDEQAPVPSAPLTGPGLTTEGKGGGASTSGEGGAGATSGAGGAGATSGEGGSGDAGGGPPGSGGGKGTPICAKQAQGCSAYPCCEGTTCVDSKHLGVNPGNPVCTKVCNADGDCAGLSSFTSLHCIEGICSATGS